MAVASAGPYADHVYFVQTSNHAVVWTVNDYELNTKIYCLSCH